MFKINYKPIVIALSVLSLVGTSLMPVDSFAANFYHANGGGYWTQYGSSWVRVNNDGYCVSWRGPCGSNLWYQQWTYNHQGCGVDESARWDMSQVVPYYGKVAAWIDGWGGGTMYAANYTIQYNNINNHTVAIDQNAYSEMFVPIANLYKVKSVTLNDAWGPGYICNSVGGKRVEFDEIKLEV